MTSHNICRSILNWLLLLISFTRFYAMWFQHKKSSEKSKDHAKYHGKQKQHSTINVEDAHVL